MNDNYKITYVYDALNRLSAVGYGDDQNVIYTYDPAGNLTAVQPNANPDVAAVERTRVAQPKQKFCNKCGETLKPEKKFCTKCGTPIKAER